MARLDTRQEEEIDLFVQDEVINFFTFSGFKQLDSGYSIFFQEGEPNERVYTVGDGITLESETSSVVWTLNAADFGSGKFSAYLISNSRVAGIFAYIKINVIISELLV